MKRWYFVVAGVALLLALMLAAAGVADARMLWCKTDPVIRVPDGTIVHVAVGVPQTHRDDGASLTITAPRGSEILSQGNGPVALTVDMKDGRDGVVTAAATPNGDYPAQVCISVGPDDVCAEGAPGKTVKVSMRLN